MKKQILLVAFMTLFCIGIASAATFVTPTAGGLMSGTYVINVTETGTGTNNLTNCTITGTSALTGETLVSMVAYNQSVGDNAANYSYFVSPDYLDCADMVLTGTCYDNASESYAITSITVGIDNTVPDTCTLTQESGKTYTPDQLFTVTGVNATSSTLKFGNNVPVTLTKSGDVYTYLGQLDQGAFDTVLATMSDGTNTTTCSLSNVKIAYDNNLLSTAVATSGAAGAKMADTQAQNNNNIILFGGAAAVAVWYFLMRKKK